MTLLPYRRILLLAHLAGDNPVDTWKVSGHTCGSSGLDYRCGLSCGRLFRGGRPPGYSAGRRDDYPGGRSAAAYTNRHH